MPKPKKLKKPKFLYSRENMEQALTAVANGMSYLEASKMYEVPRSTLIYKSTGKSPAVCKMGPKSVLSTEHELLLENWVKSMSKRGFPISKWDLLASVEMLVKEMKIENPFTNGKPGKKWLNLFLKRHPAISKRVVEKLTTSRASVTEANLRSWFEETKSILIQEGHFEILKDPTRVFNTDETAFMLCPKSEKVLGVRGQRNIYEVTGRNDKESITVLLTGSATGAIAPTMVLFPYVRIPESIAKSVPSDWALGRSEKGWMNGQNFYEYVANNFEPWLTKTKIERPIILFLDGHSSHLTVHLSKFCSENGIILISLYPNATHIMQPLDVAVFRQLKHGWQKTVHNWKMENVHQYLTKYNFAPLMDKTIKQYLKKDALINGFRLCGLYPYNPNALDYSKCIHSPKQKDVPEVPQAITKSDNSHLRYLESKMNSETVRKFTDFFINNEGDWAGEVSSKDLYYVWRSFKLDLTNKSLILERTPLKDITSGISNKTQDLTSTRSDEPSTSAITPSPTKVIREDPKTPLTHQVIQNITDNTGEKLAKTISPATNGEGVPTPFKRILFWPGTPPKKIKKGKNSTKIPTVVSSKLWQEYFEKKKSDKEEKEKIIRERRADREKRKLEKQKMTQKRRNEIPSDTSSDSDSISLVDSDHETLKEIMDSYSREESEQIESENTTPETGKWVLTELLTVKNKKQHYVGLVVAKEQDLTVKFVKKVAGKTSVFVWPEVEDISDVSLKNVVKVLPEPNMGRRDELVFNISFLGYNVL